jgi:hypothetical protein
MHTIDVTPIPGYPVSGHVAAQIDGAYIQIPIIDIPWHDERTGCERAHRYLAGQLTWHEIDAELEQCPFYQRQPIGAARCTMNGCQPPRTGPGRNPCLFHQDLDTPDWERVRAWRLLEFADGHTAVCRARDAQWIAAELTAETAAPVVVLGHVALLLPDPPAPIAHYYNAGL